PTCGARVLSGSKQLHYVFPSFARKGAWDPDVLCDLGPRCSASG
ncbi:hypothetical protein TGFOU_406960, partial [Toxoplasma gondii FOU]